MPRHSDPHPDNGSGLREYTEKQLAEIASEDPATAAELWGAYQGAQNRDTAMQIGLEIETDRANRVYPRRSRW